MASLIGQGQIVHRREVIDKSDRQTLKDKESDKDKEKVRVRETDRESEIERERKNELIISLRCNEQSLSLKQVNAI